MLEVVVEPKRKTTTESKILPPFNVILLNDDHHSFEYVISMLQQLFGFPPEKGFLCAKTVHVEGRVILMTTSKELAELKQEQIHAFGPDKSIKECAGSMTSVIEPAY